MSLQINLFNEQQTNALKVLSEGLTREQLLWVNGYFQGLLSVNNSSAPADVASTSDSSMVLKIIYGTHTGRSKTIAEKLALRLKPSGVSSILVGMDDYKIRHLQQEKNLVVIVSTHGEGEPPAMAEDFYSFVTGKRAPKLPETNFAVVALGDKSYKQYCKTGADIDEALARLGGKQILPLLKLDVDFEDDADSWITRFAETFAGIQPGISAKTSPDTDVTTVEYSRKNPFQATVIDKVKITGRGSDKEVYHLELSLEGSGIKYEPGDSVGILANNPPTLVEAILLQAGIDPNTLVTIKDGTFSLGEALANYLEITVLNREVIQKYQEKTGSAALWDILQNDEKLDQYLYGHDILDLLQEFPHTFDAQDFANLLRSFPHRLYSISSSQEAVGEEVHITVATVRYRHRDRQREGACSTYLADRIDIDSKISVFIEKNPAFKLPESPETPVILIGAGTGVAPFRAFLQHREAVNQKGKTWLFFGERRFHSDFLYQVEWQKLLKEGYLERIDVAFSRDQAEKIYVQTRLAEKQKEVYEWLEQGANIYLCGDMKQMAKDVQKTLVHIIEREGGLTPEKAEEYLKQLKKQKRFQLDVY